MFGRFFRKTKPRVFLGTVVVSPRTDLLRRLEQDDLFEGESVDGRLRRSLMEIFSLPLASSVENPSSHDLVLDVVIPKFESGELLDISLADTDLTLFWRPKITVASRLYYLTTNRTKATFSATEKMTWRQFVGRIFTWRGLFRAQPFDRDDLECLLCRACMKILVKLQRAL